MNGAVDDLYGTALHGMARPGGGRSGYARWDDGKRIRLGAALQRWCGTADPADLALLSRASGTVLDVGCGPGRLVAELHRQGRQAAGLDTSPTAVRLARRADAAVLRRSVFDPVPGEGLWDTVLLADGNVGIGGDPAALLDRCRALLDPDGRVPAEVAAAGAGLRTGRVRLESGDRVGAWFPWADMGLDAVGETAGRAGMDVHDVWETDGRAFAHLVARPPAGERAGPDGMRRSCAS